MRVRLTLLMLVFLFLAFLVLIKSLATSQSPSDSFNILPFPTPTPIQHYSPPTLPQKEAYTILFVGDSMTEALGPNFDQLRTYLKAHYPDTIFGLFNYGFAATNLSTVDRRLHQESHYQGTTHPPILNRQYDVIIIESFAHNPFSELPLTQGLEKQEKLLDDLVLQLALNKKEGVIVFLATIAPSKTHYALQSRDLKPDERLNWANERIAYLENHIQYAKQHNIPLINVYQKSLDPNGNLLLEYVNPNDYIHPSAAGVNLISAEIADFLYTNNIIPH